MINISKKIIIELITGITELSLPKDITVELDEETGNYIFISDQKRLFQLTIMALSDGVSLSFKRIEIDTPTLYTIASHYDNRYHPKTVYLD